jgi:ATP-binding cassette subfamily B protein
MELQLLKTDGIVRVNANPDTARILLLFEPSLSGTTKGLILRALDRLMGHMKNGMPVSSRATRRSLLRLMEKLTPDKKLLKAGVAWSAAYSIISLLPHFGLVSLMNTGRRKDNPLLASLGIRSIRSQMWTLFLVTMASFSVVLAVDFKKQNAWRRQADAIEQEASLQAFDHIQKQDMSVNDAQSQGKLIRLLLDDVSQVRSFWEQGADTIIQKTLYTGLTIVGLTIISPGLGALSFIPLELMLLTAGFFKKQMVPRYAKAGEDKAQVSHLLANDLSGIETIKSFTAEAYELMRLRQANDAAMKSDEEAFRITILYSNSLRLFLYTGWVAVLTAGSLLLAKDTISPGAYANMVYLIPSLINSMKGMNETVDMYRKSVAASDRLLALLDTRREIVDGRRAVLPAEIHGEIVYEQVSFAYDPDVSVLNDLNLSIPAGKITAFVGTTGIGKSTIIKLLMRFYEVSGGRITIDGINIRDLPLFFLRSVIGYVSQDVYLFYGTIHENIVYGRQDALREDVVAAARAAEADAFISNLPDGYDTLIGERGRKLSLGQRQRLSLARAVLKNPPILLLDEATSSVDNETEVAIQRSVKRLSRGRTIIIIAHRLSTIRQAHRINVVDGGTIRESGSHDDLIRMNGLYAALWRIQTGALDNHANSASGQNPANRFKGV